jgi:hypothetical protein
MQTKIFIKSAAPKLAKMDHTLISFYSDSPKSSQYRDAATDLIKRCELFNVKHDITELESAGSYSKNCLMKPGFILKKLTEYKKPVIWMDCDTCFISPFSDFNNLTVDIGMASHNGTLDQITASPIFFNYSIGAFKILREWTVHCSAAARKGIPELDHDALKHYVLPTLENNYSSFVLSENFTEFVQGKHIQNVDSVQPFKQQIWKAVWAIQDRHLIASDAITYSVVFDSDGEAEIEKAYACLLNFSNTNRIRFTFNNSLKDSKSEALRKLTIESGGMVFFDGASSIEDDLQTVNASELNTFEKNWDLVWKK